MNELHLCANINACEELRWVSPAPPRARCRCGQQRARELQKPGRRWLSAAGARAKETNLDTGVWADVLGGL